MRSLLLTGVLLALTGCAREAWITPVAALRPPRSASCPVAIEAVPEPGTKAIAIVRCSDALFGKKCWELVQEKACAAGGDVVFGAHYEESDLVATIGTAAPWTY